MTSDTTVQLETQANQEIRDQQDCLVLGDLMESEEYQACQAFRGHQDVIHLTSILSKWC